MCKMNEFPRRHFLRALRGNSFIYTLRKPPPQFLNQNPFEMIHLMLTDLCRPSAEFHLLLFPVHIIVLYFYVFVSCCFSHTCKRKTSFFCFIWSIFSRITGLNITTSTSPIFTMITLFLIPIIFVFSIPTHRHG